MDSIQVIIQKNAETRLKNKKELDELNTYFKNFQLCALVTKCNIRKLIINMELMEMFLEDSTQKQLKRLLKIQKLPTQKLVLDILSYNSECYNIREEDFLKPENVKYYNIPELCKLFKSYSHNINLIYYELLKKSGYN